MMLFAPPRGDTQRKLNIITIGDTNVMILKGEETCINRANLREGFYNLL